MNRWEVWLLARLSRTVRRLAEENRELREYQREASETIGVVHKSAQTWKARAMAAEQRLCQFSRHPSTGPVMPEEAVREFDEWLDKLPVKED